MSSSTESLTDELCTRCGICCDGVLFSSVICDTATEARRMEELGVELQHQDGVISFSHPCKCLSGTKCSVYQDRPARCRIFECELLKRVRAGERTVEQAHATIQEAFAKVASLKQRLGELGQDDDSMALAFRWNALSDDSAERSEEWWDSYAELLLDIRTMQAFLKAEFYETWTE